MLVLIPDTSLSYVWLILRRCDDLLLDLVTLPRAKVISKSEETSLEKWQIYLFLFFFFFLSKQIYVYNGQDFLFVSTTKKLVIEIELPFPTKQVHNDNKVRKKKKILFH